MTDKTLSIIVPSYNMEAYLPKCLGSLIIDDTDLLQKIDVIVVNDGSKDMTSAIAHAFEEKYPQVFTVVDKENGNYGSCINTALKLAKGEYVKVLDADDWFNTENLASFIVWLDEVVNREHGGCDLIFSDYDCFDERGNDTGRIRQGLPIDCVFDMASVVSRSNITFMHGYTYRTKLLRDMNYHQSEGISYSDMEWIFAPAVRAKTLMYFPKVIYNYLFGRSGQTVDPRVQAKSMEDYKKLMHSLLSTFVAESDSATAYGHKYMFSHLRRLVNQIYRWYFIRSPRSLFDQDLHFFEKEIKTMAPDLYAEMNEWRFPNRLGPKCIKMWRRSHSFNVAIFVRAINILWTPVRKLS